MILLINLIGGLAIGLTQHDLTLSEAGRIYTLLTIGDGLVAQIPSLLLSLATAIIVTRVTTSESMSEQAKAQLANPPAFFVSGGVLMLLGLVPGMPHLVFLTLGAGALGLGQASRINLAKRRLRSSQETEVTAEALQQELDWDDVDQVDLIGLDIGYGLIPLVNTETGGQLLSRVKGVRKKLSAELGFLIQPIRIRDNLDLQPEVYHKKRVVLSGSDRHKNKNTLYGRSRLIS